MADSIPPQLGKYELLGRIATGGMAEIFLARQPGLGRFSRLVVVKRILPHLAERRQFLDMFLEEARLASLVHHQNVVQIFDVGQDAETYFITMEYIDGLSAGVLARRARKQGVLVPVPVAAEIVVQACDGLDAAHELRDEAGNHLGLVHRDISPHNLMVAASGVVKLVDFGIAKAAGSDVRTRTGALKGKFPYMSPEQCRGEALDRRSDLFSLATVFLELLAGRRVFERASDLMTLKAITEEPLPAAHELRSAVPPSLSAVIQRAHARDPADRYAGAAEMGAAIRQVLGAEGLETSPTTLADYLRDECEELLAARKNAVKQLREITRPGQSVPRLAGFEESTAPSGSRPRTPGASRGSQPPAGAASSASSSPASRSSPWRRSSQGAPTCSPRPPGEPARPTGEPLLFGSPPYYPEATVQKGLRPLASYLEGRLDRPVDVVVTEDYEAILEALRTGRVQLANLSPVLFVELRRLEPRVEILASYTYEGARTYQSIIVARDDAGIGAPEDLRGHSFCYVDRSSTSGFLLPRHYLRGRHLDPESLFSSVRFSGTHVQVMRDVVSGRCDAGAIFSGALVSAQGLDVATSRLQLVANAGRTPWDVVVASPRLDKATRVAVRRALLDLDPERDLGRAYVSETFKIDGFVEPRPEDFESVEAAAEIEGLLAPRSGSPEGVPDEDADLDGAALDGWPEVRRRGEP